jgi:hypothetical protein
MIDNSKSQCSSAEDLIALLIDNEGDPDDIRSLQRHVDTCNRCTSVVREFKATSEIVRKKRLVPVYLSASFTTDVMDRLPNSGLAEVLDDIMGLSRRVVIAGTMFVLVLFAIMFFPEDIPIDSITGYEFIFVNGAESEVLDKDEITYDDVVSLVFTQR